MKNKIYIFCVLAILSSYSFTLKGYVKEENKDAIWIYITYPDKKLDYYIDINIDGEVLLRITDGKKKIVKEGNIKKMYAKDFFRETKNSDIMNYAKNIDLSKMLFYRGELIKISANVQGETRRVISPLNRFSQTFIYAFRQVYEEALKLANTDKYVSFIYAAPLEGEIYNQFIKKVPTNYKMPLIETRELKNNKYIFKAINNPWRMIPIPSKEAENTISEFMSLKNLYGIKSAFYLGTTRGNYQLSIVE